MKIAVIGGSIAGLEAGIRLGGSCEVTIFEEHEEIGLPLRCAEGWIIHHNLKPYARGREKREIERLRFRRLDKDFRVREEVVFETDGKVLAVDRPRMERRMAEIAARNGARILTGRRVKIRDLSGYDLIIDASGHPSQWEREFGGGSIRREGMKGERGEEKRWKKARKTRKTRKGGIALEAITDYECEDICIDVLPGLDGYLWVFPKAKGGANIGVGYYARKPYGLKDLLKTYLAWLEAEAGAEIKVEGLTAGLLGVRFNRPFVRYYNSTPVCLIGDAAGLVDPFFGEGMTKAVLSARILAEKIMEGRIEDYEREYLKTMRMHYAFSWLMTGVKLLSPWLLFKILKLAKKLVIPKK